MRVNLWRNYPLQKAVRFLDATGMDVRAHALVIGPVGFIVCWCRKEPPHD